MRLADFESAYDEHSPRVYGFLAYRLGARVDAEDLTQATFERALAAWESFDQSRASRATWLMAIARNLLIDHYRAAGARPRADVSLDELPAHRVPATPGPGGLGLAPDLEAALACLSDRERELIALRYGGDLTGPELAELTGLSLANVQQILSRSLRRLRAQLESPSVPQRPDARQPERRDKKQQQTAGGSSGRDQG